MVHKLKKRKPFYMPDETLFPGITIPEAAKLYGKHPNTVRFAIDVGQLRARKSCGTWLVSIPSLIALWGSPVKF